MNQEHNPRDKHDCDCIFTLLEKFIVVIEGIRSEIREVKISQQHLLERVNTMASELETRLDVIITKVADQDTRLDSVRELITGLRKEVKDALAQLGKLTPAEIAKVDAVMANVEKNSAEIEEALAANVPPDPEPTQA